MEKETKRTLLHIQGQVEMLKDGLVLSLGLSILYIPWVRPLIRDAFRQKTLNLPSGEGTKELEAGYEYMRDRLVELLDGADDELYKEFLDQISKKDSNEIINEMKNDPKKFLEKIAMKKIDDAERP